MKTEQKDKEKASSTKKGNLRQSAGKEDVQKDEVEGKGKRRIDGISDVWKEEKIWKQERKVGIKGRRKIVKVEWRRGRNARAE